MSISGMANMGAVNDPRINNEGRNQTTYPNRVLATLHDKSITLEEYMHYAKLTREEEERLYGAGSGFAATDGPLKAFVKGKILRKPVNVRQEVPLPRLSISAQGEPMQEKTVQDIDAGSDVDKERRGSVIISDEEWVQASRAARTATWSAIFYLITTDILGPFSTGYAFAQMGFGPGVALFTIFGVLSWYSAYQLWRMFIQLDSDRYPMKGYGDVAFRVYGTWFRHTVNVLQSFQFFMNVALIILGSGQGISQMSKGKLCFIVCVVVCAIAGCIIGQIRTLQRFGWLASSAVFMNLLIIFCTMGVIAHSAPNYVAAYASYPSLFPDGPNNPPPVKISAASPPGLDLVDNVNGLMNAVFSFGGATLFVELMAEMRRPMDFWKGMICAEVLIYVCYMVYGCFCYAMQGQYVFNPSYQGVSPYGWQTFGNVLGLITGMIAAVLYGNIGIKVLYNNLGRDLLNFPILESKKGKWIFVFCVPIYWISAWVIATSVPQISSWIVFVGAACILQFTYTFPPFLMVGFKSQRDAILPEETFDPVTGAVVHSDSGMKRWVRGFKKELLWNIWDTIFSLGSFATGILGIYSAITLMNGDYHNGSNLTGWSCKSPTG